MRLAVGRGRTWFLLTCFAILVSAGFTAQLPYFIDAPGRLLTLGAYIDVDSEHAVPVRGDYLLTSVSLRRATPFGLMRAWIDPARGLRPANRVVQAERTDQEHFAGQRRIFALSAQRAAALGLRHAGFTADPDRFIGDGAVVVGVVGDSPADGVLRAGDIIIAVDGIRVLTEADVRVFIEDQEPEGVRFTREGEPLAVRFVREGRTHEIRLTPHRIRVDGEHRLALGLHLETLNSRIDLPVPVSVTSGRIGGPSAALMIALAVYDQSDPSIDLAGGRRIAGTGTLTSQGAVGRIGGVDLKALAAHRRDADVFLVPEPQFEAALQRLPADTAMEVVPVTTFEGAVRHLAETSEPDPARRPFAPVRCPARPAA